MTIIGAIILTILAITFIQEDENSQETKEEEYRQYEQDVENGYFS